MDLWDCIIDLGAGAGPALSAPVFAAMGSVVVPGSTVDGGVRRGEVDLVVGSDVLGAAGIRLGEGLFGRWGFVLQRQGAGFVLDVTLLAPQFALPDAIRPARLVGGQPVEDGVGPVRVVLPDVTLRIEASRADERERLSFVGGGGDGLIEADVVPGIVLLGGTGFGLEMPKVVFDASTGSTPALPPPASGSPPLSLPPAWTGLVVPQARLYFPAGGPQIVPEPVAVQLAVGDDGSVLASGHHRWPSTASRPEIEVAIVVDDPFAASLVGMVPTFAQATVSLASRTEVAELVPLETSGVVVTATWTRLATPPGGAPPTVILDVVAAGGGERGLVSLAYGSSVAANLTITAATLADVVMNGLFGADGYVGLGVLVGAGALLAETQVDDGSLVLTRAEASAGLGPGAPDPVLVLDYDAAVHLQGVAVNPFALKMDGGAPIALSYQGVKVHQAPDGRLSLDYSDARVDVRSTGGWHIEPADLPLRIPAVRFGQGSLWVEFDLDVSLPLGPISVDRATLRLHLDGQRGFVNPELRGLGIHLDVPGALRVAGQARIGTNGLEASLSGHAGPGGKGFAVTALFRKGQAFTGLAVEVAFPGPIPLANSGFGLFGAEGGFAIGVRPSFAPGDPVKAALEWRPDLDADHWWRPDRGSFTFWLGLLLGTLPDAGFSLSAHARLAVAVPDLLFRLSLDAALLALPGTLAAAESGPVGGAGPGPSFLGVLQAGPAGVDIGVKGHVDLLPLLEVDVPFGAHFPASGDAWFIRLGTDGDPDRPPGPVKVSFLPDLLGINAWAFLMFEGAGISNVGQRLLGITLPPTTSFTVAFGAGFDLKYGNPPFWLEVSGSLVAEVCTNPFLIAAAARIGGSLHLGPFSIGADAKIDLIAGIVDGRQVLWAEARVCGSVDLWLFEIEGCVTIEIGSRPRPVVTPPNPLVALSLMRLDGQVTPLGPGGGSATLRTPADPIPTVWPDTIPTLAFATMPASGGAAGNVRIGPNAASGRVGSNDLLFAYRLARLDLLDQDGRPFRPVGADGNPTDLLATVQLGKGPEGGRELAINTWSSAVWARALEDGGTSTGDPATVAVQQCDPHIDPAPGWTLGADAAGAFGTWHLPPELVELDPLRSTLAADVELFSAGSKTLEAPFGWQVETDSTSRFVPPRVERFAAALLAPEVARSFPGCLWLGWTEQPGYEPTWTNEGLRASVALASPLGSSVTARPTLCLIMDRRLAEGSLEVYSDGRQWDVSGVDRASGVDGYSVATFTWSTDGAVDEITFGWAHGALGLVGLGGVTEAARVVADERIEAIRRRHQAVQASAAAGAGPPVGPGHLFAPGREYQVVAQLEAVQVHPPDQRGEIDLDAPATGTARRFRIAEEGPPADESDWHILNDESRFCPEYLRRYLHPQDPTVPADLARFVFPADPVTVSFWVGHTEQLAGLYGYGLHVRIRQVDAHPTGQKPAATFIDLATLPPDLGGAPAFAVDQRIAQLAATLGPFCNLPPSGSTKTIPAVLGCDGHYELRIVAVRGDAERKIRTTTFATSRYQDPADLLWELGFVDDAVGWADAVRTTQRCWQPVVRTPAPPGELAVNGADGSAGEVHSDHELDEALDLLGLAPWPLCTAPRRWHLWAKAPALEADADPLHPNPAAAALWYLQGVLLEAPEPIVRRPRVTFGTATVGGAPLGSVVADASGCRVLFRPVGVGGRHRSARPKASRVVAGRFTLPVNEVIGGGAGSSATARSWVASAAVPAGSPFADEVAVR